MSDSFREEEKSYFFITDKLQDPVVINLHK